jgi:hypothetical protein
MFCVCCVRAGCSGEAKGHSTGGNDGLLIERFGNPVVLTL